MPYKLHYLVCEAGDSNPKRKGNLLGHTMTQDPDLKDWTITSIQEPLIEDYEYAPDGMENAVVGL